MTDKYDKATAIAVMRALAQGMRNTLASVERDEGHLGPSSRGIAMCVTLIDGCANEIERTSDPEAVSKFVSVSTRVFQDG